MEIRPTNIFICKMCEKSFTDYHEYSFHEHSWWYLYWRALKKNGRMKPEDAAFITKFIFAALIIALVMTGISLAIT